MPFLWLINLTVFLIFSSEIKNPSERMESNMKNGIRHKDRSQAARTELSPTERTEPTSNNNHRVKVSRPIYTESEFQKEYKYLEENHSIQQKIIKSMRKIQCTPNSAWNFVRRLVPILKWLPRYNIRNDILGDMLSGMTTAIMRIPQGMTSTRSHLEASRFLLTGYT